MVGESKMQRPDIETRMRYRTTPASMEVVSNSKRGNKFLRNWITDDDDPMRDEDGRLWIILIEDDVRKCLADAARTGLTFADRTMKEANTSRDMAQYLRRHGLRSLSEALNGDDEN